MRWALAFVRREARSKVAALVGRTNLGEKLQEVGGGVKRLLFNLRPHPLLAPPGCRARTTYRRNCAGGALFSDSGNRSQIRGLPSAHYPLLGLPDVPPSSFPHLCLSPDSVKIVKQTVL